MPTLSCFFAIYTDGGAPHADLPVPRGVSFAVTELPKVVLPGKDVELFGPHASAFARATPKKAFLLSMRHETNGSVGNFFADTHRTLVKSVHGLKGFGLDVLRLWPFPLAAVDEMPDDPFAEDLLSVGFHEQGEHGFRAETFGLAKLGQRELSFAFRGRELLEDAAMLCAHLGDYAMGQPRRVGHQQTMSFGFDKLLFVAAEGESETAFRGWHPEVMQQLVPETLFPGVGVLEVMGYDSATSPAQSDITEALRRAHEQRMVLEEYDLAGESPHQSATAKSCSCVGENGVIRAERFEPQTVRDSGWSFSCAKTHGRDELVQAPLGSIAFRFPFAIRFLALPVGSKVTFDGEKARVDVSRAKRDEDNDTLG